MVLASLLVTTTLAATAGDMDRTADPPCTEVDEFAGIVLETGCLREIIDICDAYLNDEMQRLPEHQQNAVCFA